VTSLPTYVVDRTSGGVASPSSCWFSIPMVNLESADPISIDSDGGVVG
jgi:hypothetical protein